MTERVAIVGSRAHPNLNMVRAYVRGLSPEVTVISGGARGADDAAATMAVKRGLGCITHAPDPACHSLGRRITGRDGLLYRNTLIALDCDRMVVFPDGSRGGCWDAAREAVRFKRPVEVRWCDGRVEAFTGGRGR